MHSIIKNKHDTDLIEVKTQEKEKLKEISLKIPGRKNPKVILYNVNKGTSEEEIKAELISQNDRDEQDVKVLFKIVSPSGYHK